MSEILFQDIHITTRDQEKLSFYTVPQELINAYVKVAMTMDNFYIEYDDTVINIPKTNIIHIEYQPSYIRIQRNIKRREMREAFRRSFSDETDNSKTQDEKVE